MLCAECPRTLGKAHKNAAGSLRRHGPSVTVDRRARSFFQTARHFGNNQPHFLQVTECSRRLWPNVLLSAQRIDCGAGSVSCRVSLFGMHLNSRLHSTKSLAGQLSIDNGSSFISGEILSHDLIIRAHEQSDMRAASIVRSLFGDGPQHLPRADIPLAQNCGAARRGPGPRPLSEDGQRQAPRRLAQRSGRVGPEQRIDTLARFYPDWSDIAQLLHLWFAE